MNTDVFWQSSLAIQIHMIAALLALVIGLYMWWRPKGTTAHKMVGRGFIILMLVTAISAVFIRHINNGHFSWIHIFVPVTFFSAFQAIYHIRKRDIKRHKSAVKGMFFGALLIPGAFAFMPGRVMYRLFFGG